jgi:MFS transporter, YNFM family, putative membrane transport protein
MTSDPQTRHGSHVADRVFDLPLVAVMLAGCSTFLNVYTTQPLLPFLRQIFHASELEVSLTVSATTIATALAAPFVGLLAEVVGRKRVIVPSIFALTVPTLLAATSGSLHALIVWRFLQGICIPGIVAVILAYIGEEFHDRGVGAAMAAYVAGTVLGGFLGRFLTGEIAAHWSWRGAFVVLGILNLASGILVQMWLPKSSTFEHGRPLRQLLREAAGHLANPRLLANFGMGFSLLFALVGAFTYVNFHLAAPPYQLGTAQLGSVFFVYLFGVVVTPLGGRLLDRRGFRAASAACVAFMLVGLVLTLAAPFWILVIGLALFSTGMFIGQSAATVQTSRIAGRSRSTAAGLYVTVYYIGGSLGAVAPAWFWSRAGWSGCVGLFAAGAFATLVFAYLCSMGDIAPVSVALNPPDALD